MRKLLTCLRTRSRLWRLLLSRIALAYENSERKPPAAAAAGEGWYLRFSAMRTLLSIDLRSCNRLLRLPVRRVALAAIATASLLERPDILASD